MSEVSLLARLKDAIVNLDFDGSKHLAQEALAKGIPPNEIITKAISSAMEEVGRKFEASEYFLSELIVAGEIGKEISQMLQPYMKDAEIKKIGKVVIGTVKGDLHDIGKNIFGMMLEAAGFEVIDLGNDVPAEAFVEAVKNHEPDIVGMSALLTVTMVEMENVIKELKKAGLREKVKVIIGGAPITEEYAKRIGADGYGKDAVVGVDICKAWIGKK
ncbi:MAG: corrinoid protein [Candidatus Brockarchaeota archaeon]|nr:corrinoid protein [Candidatus Brockarchaeota archaeon]MBO3840792.1 corrinoid protein [Candidatus Brockarchaeota archaeon]